jgi:hypothetical protein
MIADGKKLSARSVVLVKEWILRWKQEDESVMDVLEPAAGLGGDDSEMDLD